MDLKNAQINKLVEEISRICTHGNILLLFSTSNIIRDLNLKSKIKEKENKHRRNFVATANPQKVVVLNTKFVQRVNQDSTAVKTAKDKIGNKVTIKNAKKSKRQILRNDQEYSKNTFIIIKKKNFKKSKF